MLLELIRLSHLHIRTYCLTFNAPIVYKFKLKDMNIQFDSERYVEATYCIFVEIVVVEKI